MQISKKHVEIIYIMQAGKYHTMNTVWNWLLIERNTYVHRRSTENYLSFSYTIMGNFYVINP